MENVISLKEREVIAAAVIDAVIYREKFSVDGYQTLDMFGPSKIADVRTRSTESILSKLPDFTEDDVKPMVNGIISRLNKIENLTGENLLSYTRNMQTTLKLLLCEDNWF